MICKEFGKIIFDTSKPNSMEQTPITLNNQNVRYPESGLISLRPDNNLLTVTNIKFANCVLFVTFVRADGTYLQQSVSVYTSPSLFTCEEEGFNSFFFEIKFDAQLECFWEFEYKLSAETKLPAETIFIRNIGGQ